MVMKRNLSSCSPLCSSTSKMSDGDAPAGPSLVSFTGTRGWLITLLCWAIFLSTTLQNAAVDYRSEDRNEFLSPYLNSSTNVVRMGQNVSLSCSSKNASVELTYQLFLGKKHLETKRRRGEADFYLKISNANETGPYKCKAQYFDSRSKYSQEFNFTIAKEDGCPWCLPALLTGVLLGLLAVILVLFFLIRQKRKEGKVLRENECEGFEDAPTQGELYVNICEAQTEEVRQPQELHYATPVFTEVVPREQEGCVDSRANHIYSEFTH